MAYLATLEGDGNITLDDLFNVNDYLGVKYFGVPAWNRIKEFACKLTQNAASSPTLFCIANCDKEYNKPSELSCALFGFVDDMGVCAMGSTAWNTLKRKIDSELLGGWLTNTVKKVGGAAGTLVDAAKTVVNAPAKVMDFVVNDTPLKYTPAGYVYNKVDDYVLEPVRDTTKNVVQAVTDVSNAALYNLATKVPLINMTPTAKLVAAQTQAKEAAGLTTPGTTGLYESAEARAEREAAEAAAAQAEAAARGAAKAAAAASAQRSAGVAQAKLKQEKAATQKALDVMENRAESKYAPIVMIGVFGLLALSILKK